MLNSHPTWWPDKEVSGASTASPHTHQRISDAGNRITQNDPGKHQGEMFPSDKDDESPCWRQQRCESPVRRQKFASLMPKQTRMA